MLCFQPDVGFTARHPTALPQGLVHLSGCQTRWAQRVQAHGGVHPSVVSCLMALGALRDTAPALPWLPGGICASPSGDAQALAPWGCLAVSPSLCGAEKPFKQWGDIPPLSSCNPAHLGGSALSPSVGAGDPHALEAPGSSTHLGYNRT